MFVPIVMLVVAETKEEMARNMNKLQDDNEFILSWGIEEGGEEVIKA